MRLRLEVTVVCRPTREERAEAVRNYEATPEVPEPDDEWITEEVAIQRIHRAVEGVEHINVVDCQLDDEERAQILLQLDSKLRNKFRRN